MNGIRLKPRFKVTPEYLDGKILTEPYEIFVYGSNTEAIHGSGSALTALKDFGAVYGIGSMGLVNRSYGIITKDFNGFRENDVAYKQRMLAMITSQVHTLYKFAEFRNDLHFYVTKIATLRAGFTVTEISTIFQKWDTPKNVILPKEFIKKEYKTII